MSVAEIARLFDVPLELLGDTTSALANAAEYTAAAYQDLIAWIRELDEQDWRDHFYVQPGGWWEQ